MTAFLLNIYLVHLRIISILTVKIVLVKQQQLVYVYDKKQCKRGRGNTTYNIKYKGGRCGPPTHPNPLYGLGTEDFFFLEKKKLNYQWNVCLIDQLFSTILTTLLLHLGI